MAGEHMTDPPGGEIPDHGSAAMTAGDRYAGAVGQARAGSVARPAHLVGREHGGLSAVRQVPNAQGLVGVEGDRDGQKAR